jgi:hypothetical protein
MLVHHIALQLVDLRMEHQVNRFMGCDYNIEVRPRSMNQSYCAKVEGGDSPPKLQYATETQSIHGWRSVPHRRRCSKYMGGDA